MHPIPQPASESVADKLRAARELISSPRRWGRGSYNTSQGRYCALGACAAVVVGENVPPAEYGYYLFSDQGWAVDDALTKAFRLLYVEGAVKPKVKRNSSVELEDIVSYGTTAYWNDALTHSEVLAGFDRAIEMAAHAE